MGVFGLTSFLVARREEAGALIRLHSLTGPGDPPVKLVVDAPAVLHWLLQRSDDAEPLCHGGALLGGEYWALDLQIRSFVRQLCYSHSEGVKASRSLPTEEALRVRLRFLADASPLTAPGSERKLDEWRERAETRRINAARLKEHCSAPPPSAPDQEVVMMASLCLRAGEADVSQAAGGGARLVLPTAAEVAEVTAPEKAKRDNPTSPLRADVEVPLPQLAMQQLQATIEALSREANSLGQPPPADFSVAFGEADEHAAWEVSSGEAFGVLSSDSDFAVMRGCRFLPLQLLSVDDQGGASGWVFTPDTVAQALNVDVAALADVAALCGNDITGSAMDRSGLPSSLGLVPRKPKGPRTADQRVSPLDAASWVNGALAMRLEDLPLAASAPPELMDALAASRRFYESPEPPLPPEPSSSDPPGGGYTREAHEWLARSMAAGRLPNFSMAVALNGKFRGAYGISSPLHAELRQRIYALLGRGGGRVAEVVRNGRSRNSRNAVRAVEVTQELPRWCWEGGSPLKIPTTWQLRGVSAPAALQLSLLLLQVTGPPRRLVPTRRGGAGGDGSPIMRQWAADPLVPMLREGHRGCGGQALALRYLLCAQAATPAAAANHPTPCSFQRRLAHWEFAAMAATLSTCSSSLPPPPSLGEALESHPPLPLLHASEVLQSSLSIASHVLQLTGAAGQGDDLDDKSWSQGFRFPPPSATFSGRVFAALYCQAAMQVAAGGSPPCARPAPPFRRMARSASPDGESAPGGGDGTEGGSPDAGEERWDWTYGGLLSPAVSRLASRVALAALWGSPDLGPTVGPEELPLLSGAAATARASDVTVHCRGLLIRLPVSATNPSPPQAAPLTSFVQGAGSCIETVEQGGDLRPLGQRGGRRRASAPVRLPPDPKEVPPPSRAVLKGLCPPGLPRGGMQREQDGRSGVQAAKPLTGREALSPLEEGCKPLKPEGKPGNCCGSDQVRMLLAALDEDPSKVLREAEAAGRAAAALPQGRFPTCSARASSRAAANPSAPQAADKRGRAGESRSQTNGWKPPTLRGGVESGKGVKELVVWEHRDAIVQEVWGGRGATCIVGETGCGKSTVVPLLLLWESARRGEKGRVVVAQPRRLAASSLAVRVASTIGQPLGREVGYAIGRERVASRHTKLLFVTTGYLLEKLAHAPSWLAGCAHVVLDEAHERSAEADLLALLLKRLGAKRQDEGRSSFPRITVMSATLQASVFSSYFSGTGLEEETAPPPLVVGTRRFSVEELYLEDLCGEKLPEAAASTLQALGCPDLVDPKAAKLSRQLCQLRTGSGRPQISDAAARLGASLAVNAGLAGAGAVLVFVPGLAEIGVLREALQEEAAARGAEESLHGCVLHSLVPASEQEVAMRPPPTGCFKVVLATNVAESSITIPDVTLVVDFCLQRILDHDEARCISTLRLQWTSAASKAQRAGRAGRVSPGVVVRLVSRAASAIHPSFDPPALLRESLDQAILRMCTLLAHLGDVRDLLQSAPQPPDPLKVELSMCSLQAAGCLESDGKTVTALGRLASSLPVSIRISRLITLSLACGCCEIDCLAIAAALTLSVEPFALPHRSLAKSAAAYLEATRLAQTGRERMEAREYSEPMAYARLYTAWMAGPQTRNWAHSEGLSYMRMKQFDGLVTELARCVKGSAEAAGIPVGAASLARLSWVGRKQEAPPLDPTKTQGRARAPASPAIMPNPFSWEGGKADEAPPSFTGDGDLLRCLMAAAFSPCFASAAVGRLPPGQEKQIQDLGLCVSRTVRLRHVAPGMQDEAKLKAVVEHAVGAKQVAACKVKGSTAWVELAADGAGSRSSGSGNEEGLQGPPGLLPGDLPLSAKRLVCTAAGQTWKVKLPNPRFPSPVGSADAEPEVAEIGRLDWANALCWSVLGGSQPVIPSWRGPLRAAADNGDEAPADAKPAMGGRAALRPHLAVALGMLQGTAGPGAGGPLRAVGMSLLPSRGALGLMLVLSTLNDAKDLRLCVEHGKAAPEAPASPRRIAGVMLGDQVLGQLRPLWLTPADLLAVEALRAAISRAFAGLGAPGDLLVAVEGLRDAADSVASRPPLSKADQSVKRWRWLELPGKSPSAGSRGHDPGNGTTVLLPPLGCVEALENLPWPADQ